MALIIEIKVVPASGRHQWKLEGNRLKCYLKNPAQKGKANAELLMLLAAALQIPLSKIHLQAGATTRIKRIKIDAPLSFDTLLKALGIEQQMKLF